MSPDRFARSKGGHLHDGVHDRGVGTIDELETYLLELLIRLLGKNV